MGALSRAFEKVKLRDRSMTNSSRQNGSRRNEKEKTTMRDPCCFICGEREHIGANCPTKNLGVKCFECGGRGHFAAKCPRKRAGGSVVASVSHVAQKKCTKGVSINGRIVTALIDTGSDISIMRASEHVAVGSPKLEVSEVQFCGVGGYSATTLGEFRAQIVVDDNTYSILIRVVPDAVLQYGLLIGTDFLDTVEKHFKRGIITINPTCKQTVDDETRPEIFTINVMRDTNAMDENISHLRDEHRCIIGELIENYRPSKSLTRELDIKMTITLRDDEPVYQKARRLSQSERDIVNAQIDEWERQGIVRPSFSDFASPVVLVKKKDGSHRLCVDY